MSGTYAVTFDGNNLELSVPKLDVLGVPDVRPRRTLNSESVARTSRTKVTSGFYTERYPIVHVVIAGTSVDDLQSNVDTLLSILQGVEKQLVIPQSSGTRAYTATLDDVQIIQSGGAFWEANLIFQCSDNYGYDVSYTTLFNWAGVREATRSDPAVFAGSADWQAPYFSLTYSYVTGGSSATVTLGNAANGQRLSITRTWATNDVLVVDCENSTVQVNGSNVAFTGAFPIFQKGSATVTYTDGFTARAFTYLLKYRKRWI